MVLSAVIALSRSWTRFTERAASASEPCLRYTEYFLSCLSGPADLSCPVILIQGKAHDQREKTPSHSPPPPHPPSPHTSKPFLLLSRQAGRRPSQHSSTPLPPPLHRPKPTLFSLLTERQAGRQPSQQSYRIRSRRALRYAAGPEWAMRAMESKIKETALIYTSSRSE